MIIISTTSEHVSITITATLHMKLVIDVTVLMRVKGHLLVHVVPVIVWKKAITLMQVNHTHAFVLTQTYACTVSCTSIFTSHSLVPTQVMRQCRLLPHLVTAIPVRTKESSLCHHLTPHHFLPSFPLEATLTQWLSLMPE